MSDNLHRDSELVSLLVDGRLRGAQFGRAVEHLSASADARQAWDSYHLIGEVMRSGPAQARGHDPAFVQRLLNRISTEATKNIAIDALSIRAEGQNTSKPRAANDGWWLRIAGIASVALVGVLAWQGYLLMDQPAVTLVSSPATANPATAPVAMASAEASGSMLRDPRLDALMAAHRQFGGASALQMPSGFLRNATFDEGER
ncbi:MAG TPA: sigma-E factor negative regulatory protein [Rhodoferax sp.]|nr:sigma-E factor negative regulatory protein [Rhodoferax sp.]